jgi:hypothetical protein
MLNILVIDKNFDFIYICLSVEHQYSIYDCCCSSKKMA